MTSCAPHKIYGNIEPKTLDQFYTALKHPAIVQGALMPDAHFGYSLPIGGVVAAKDTIFPAFVGYDIGCAAVAVPTTFTYTDIKSNQNNIFNRIYEKIPTGLGKYRDQINSTFEMILLRLSSTDTLAEIYKNKNAGLQIGTLGSGNHFIEVGISDDNVVWFIIHSGSRGLGHGVGTYYMKQASGGRKAREGCFGVDTNTTLGQDYIMDMNFCLQFAMINRHVMLQDLEHVIQEFCDGETKWEDLISRNHNHADKKDGLWIHRKGATHAEEGMMGVIPGNMRDGSFIVRGKGNPESLWSSSHGAGRTKSRKAAKQDISIEVFTKQMEGITARVEPNIRDEAPDAYKNIFEVMELQKDLVEIVTYVKPMINVKG